MGRLGNCPLHLASFGDLRYTAHNRRCVAVNEIRFVVSPRIMGEEKFFGPGIAVLLHRVETYRSIRQATMSMGMAYSKAWAIIRRAERELGFSLLNTTTGGKEGGGASLTEEGRRFLEQYDRFCALVNEHARMDFEAAFGRPAAPAPAKEPLRR